MQIEKLMQTGHLNRYIRLTSPRRHQIQDESMGRSAGTNRRERSRSRQRTPTHRGTIATISGGGVVDFHTNSNRGMKRTKEGRRVERIQTVLTGANVTPLGRREPTPTISFDDRDMKRRATGQDEPMVISVVVVEYKIERVLIDQGSSANILYWSTVQKMQLSTDWLQECSRNLYGFVGECVPIKGTVELKTSFGERSDLKTIPVLYTVMDALASYNIIIGRPTLNRLGTVVSTKHLCMKFPVGRRVGSVWADSQVAQRCYEDSLRVGKYTPACVVNALDLDLDPRGRYEHEGPHPAEDLKEIQLGFRPEQTTKIGTTMNPEGEDLLVTFLKANHDVFAWSAQDMRGMDPDFMCHRLSIEQGAKPVAQKKRKQGEEKREAVREETRKFLSTGFVREVQYPTWLANVVMVKKPSGKWRMCTDYTDLNKACPKDPYPLSSIDRLVDSIARFALLSFMDAYSGYNQIRMHPQDEEKMAFITNDGAFCYRVMPFGLKNAGATYQCLMDKIFQGILGADVEVYVNDMVVESQGVAEHCEVLGRVFHILRKHQLILNPDKCSFGVRAGKFLGFMLIERGIEANPEKCRAVVDVRSPQSVKEVQQFMGKVTTLSHFISKAAETTTPIFATLKKRGKFMWMAECEEAFLRLKVMMAAPPVLILSSPGTRRKKGNNGLYILLARAERRYQKIEKAALALVIASQPLCPYFQNFSIIVRIDFPIRQVLRKPDMAGRMVAWSIQLLEFDISFEQRGHVKAQALANFITELTPEGPPTDSKGEWYLLVDGSTNQSGSGAWVILEGPDGILIEQSLHFDFRASNNQAEYEALLAGMRLARDLEVRSLTAKSDSKLVTGQAAKLTTTFEKFELINVPRDQNERADLLTKLASTQRRGQLRSVIHENLETPTIDREEVWNVEEKTTWMTPLIQFLQDGRVLENDQEARRVVKEVARYTLVGQQLYRRGFAFPLLKCQDGEET
ncbi:hypothetical protein CR513_55807, partial [Mucuna pruriens]